MTKADQVIENFLLSMHGLTLDEALANAELDVRSYNLDLASARKLGAAIRAHYAKGAK